MLGMEAEYSGGESNIGTGGGGGGEVVGEMYRRGTQKREGCRVGIT